MVKGRGAKEKDKEDKIREVRGRLGQGIPGNQWGRKVNGINF